MVGDTFPNPVAVPAREQILWRSYHQGMGFFVRHVKGPKLRIQKALKTKSFFPPSFPKFGAIIHLIANLT